MGLTGKFRFRKSFWGRIVLQVEEEVKPFWSRLRPLKPRWRDATLMDLAAPELRPLIDMRSRRQLRFQAPPRRQRLLIVSRLRVKRRSGRERRSKPLKRVGQPIEDAFARAIEP